MAGAFHIKDLEVQTSYHCKEAWEVRISSFYQVLDEREDTSILPRFNKMVWLLRHDRIYKH